MTRRPDGSHRPDGLHRVVVTGLGAVCGLGVGVAALLSGLRSGASAIRPVSRSLADDTLTVPASETVYDEAALPPAVSSAVCDPFVRHALMAAAEAVADAGLERRDLADAAVVLGCGGGGELTREEGAVQLLHRRRPRVNPMTVPRTNHQAAVSHICAAHGIGGPSFVIATGCASGSHAVAQAARMVRHGEAPLAITGGTEASILYSVIRAFQALRVVSSTTCRPFSQGRDGFAFGDGAGVVMIETMEGALARGAPILAELAGSGLSTDASDQVHPNVAGPVRAIRSALADAGMSPGEVDYINGHGTATALNDAVECRAVREVFGAGAPPLSSIKGQIGHCFGAAGGLETVATVLALAHGFMPPTVNFLGEDPDCAGVDCVPNRARAAPLGAALSQSFAFGGLNAVLAFRAAEG